MQERKQNRWLVTIALLMVFGPIVWVSATFVVLSRTAEALDAGCNRNLEQLSRAFQTYAAQHGGKLPDAKHWVDQLQPHLANKEVLHCPADNSGKRSSYAMNTHLSGQHLSTPVSSTVLLYETKNTGDNPTGTGKDAVDVGRDTKGRHFRLANRYNFYLTADFQIHRIRTEAELKKLQWDVVAKP